MLVDKARPRSCDKQALVTRQPDYTGPLVARLGGADISWIIGFIVLAAVYLLLAPRAQKASRHGHPAPAPAG